MSDRKFPEFPDFFLALGRKQTADLLERYGGAYNVDQVAEILDITPPGVDELRAKRELIALRNSDDFVYPAIQFHNHAILPGLADLLDSLRSSSWTAFGFLVLPNEDLRERSPAEVLLYGSNEERALALRLARMIGDNS